MINQAAFVFDSDSEYHDCIPELREAERMFNYATNHDDIDNAIRLMNIAENKLTVYKVAQGIKSSVKEGWRFVANYKQEKKTDKVKSKV